MASGISIDINQMRTYPKMFGYTDPIRYLQSLPGVSTNSDQNGGLHVQGGLGYFFGYGTNYYATKIK